MLRLLPLCEVTMELMKNMKIKTYSELIMILTFEERFEYLKIGGRIGEQTFGSDRYYNQRFYRSAEWKRVRNEIILRDNGCDLGCPDRPIPGKIIIHHLNPIIIDDIDLGSEYLLNPDYLICVSHNTHNALHYGDKSLLPKDPVERRPYDTCPWKG